ncbi:hypothetical protein [Pseudomonas rubra]|uniref:Uncharacterized protein n=1 Tax=Pseudomonas rubra TaxID=2942627 RepID=A0ABT5PA51_9PSED|nr:hypothetical protein [Pseudomonas rubra]MDD1015100.1 hypothetical protein [Pseudomonas rubra]MDD1038565.1 hypothetical protein [Pseudomonas rubra]MDD1154743.1 hypothetical protein [Pseudomonas rubra]
MDPLAFPGGVDHSAFTEQSQRNSHLNAVLSIWEKEYHISAQSFSVTELAGHILLTARGGIQPVGLLIPLTLLPVAGEFVFNLHEQKDVQILLGGRVVPVNRGDLHLKVTGVAGQPTASYEGFFNITLEHWGTLFRCSNFLFTNSGRPVESGVQSDGRENRLVATRRSSYQTSTWTAREFNLSQGPGTVFLFFRAEFTMFISIDESKIPVSGSYKFDLEKDGESIYFILEGGFVLPYGEINLQVEKGEGTLPKRITGSFRVRNEDMISSIVCEDFSISSNSS